MACMINGVAKKPSTFWNENDKTKEIRQLFKHHEIFFPEKFYTPALNAVDLEKMLELLGKYLNLRTLPSIIFSDRISNDGHLEIESKKATIIINTRYLGNPYACGAILAHSLCHYVLIVKRTIIFSDYSENEKIADLATIQSGLGLIILNGIRPMGWHGYFANIRQFISRRCPPGLGYYMSNSYTRKLRSYLETMHIASHQVASHTVPWAQKLLYKKDRSRNSQPAFMREARYLHKRSLSRFWIGVSILFCFSLGATYIFARSPAFLSDELRLQKQKVDDIYSSYIGCAKRIDTLKLQYEESDPSVSRYIDSELTKCKSLENRYNHEVQTYNNLLPKYDE